MTQFLYSDLGNFLDSSPHQNPFQELPEVMSTSPLPFEDPPPQDRESPRPSSEASPPLTVHIHRSALGEGRVRSRGHLSSSPFAQVFDLRKGKWILIPVSMAEKLLAIGRVAFTESGEPLLPPSHGFGATAKAAGNQG